MRERKKGQSPTKREQWLQWHWFFSFFPWNLRKVFFLKIGQIFRFQGRSPFGKIGSVYAYRFTPPSPIDLKQILFVSAFIHIYGNAGVSTHPNVSIHSWSDHFRLPEHISDALTPRVFPWHQLLRIIRCTRERYQDKPTWGCSSNENPAWRVAGGCDLFDFAFPKFYTP